LTAGDHELAHQIIAAVSRSGKFDYYNGPIGKVLRELLRRYPVPEDLTATLSEADPEVQSRQVKAVQVEVGAYTMGFRTPGIVENVRVPADLGYFVTVEQLSKEYNIVRGDIASYRVTLSDYLKLTRLPDELSPIGEHSMMVFEFQADGRTYLLRYDPGSDKSPAALYIDQKKEL
jgi:hypothetical protein